MHRVLALTAGVLVALVPAGTAFAGDVPGKAYGNCKHSSSVGNPHSALLPEVGHGKGNGGLVQLAKSGAGCVAPTPVVAPTPPAEQPTPPVDEPTPPVVEPTPPVDTDPPADTDPPTDVAEEIEPPPADN